MYRFPVKNLRALGQLPSSVPPTRPVSPAAIAYDAMTEDQKNDFMGTLSDNQRVQFYDELANFYRSKGDTRQAKIYEELAEDLRNIIKEPTPPPADPVWLQEMCILANNVAGSKNLCDQSRATGIQSRIARDCGAYNEDVAALNDALKGRSAAEIAAVEEKCKPPSGTYKIPQPTGYVSPTQPSVAPISFPAAGPVPTLTAGPISLPTTPIPTMPMATIPQPTLTERGPTVPGIETRPPSGIPTATGVVTEPTCLPKFGRPQVWDPLLRKCVSPYVSGLVPGLVSPTGGVSPTGVSPVGFSPGTAVTLAGLPVSANRSRRRSSFSVSPW